MTNDVADDQKNPGSWLTRARLWLGVACCLQFLVCGMVGVVRGYSVQSWAPIWIFLIGFVLLIPLHTRHKWVSFLSYLCMIVFSLVGTGQGKHHIRGKELYDAGRYKEAMTEFRQEMGTWYLRLTFNYHEATSLFKIAQCQSQLGQFDEARETYLDMMRWFHGYYKGRAEQEQLALDAKLAKIHGLESEIAKATNDSERAELRFDLALTYRELTCTSKAIEQYEAIQKLDAPEKFKESAKRYADDLR